ncbi:glycosyltransferase family 2 protein [Nocardia asteroides]|uniref:glycosyltransferase family 2 protein n=1 Tax=Nocardia asteroides TaxID=1824 RepID=UPI001E36E906|nr:glycosyltransferase family A protein [Nocardia asteroides]UGT62773.1 glycosyltransferase family 2 protein [Nocardia asteroides]
MVSLSVCVPAYQAGRTLEPTMRSILSQDVEFELLVLDNASTDETGEIAASFGDPRVRIERNDSTLRIGDNWNRVIELSTGELVKVVCADDILLPGSLATQLEIMRDRAFALSSSRFQVIDEGGALVETGLGLPGLDGVHGPRELARTIVRRGPADFGPTAAAMFRREHFDRVGGLRGDLVFPMDVDLFARVGQFGLFYGLTEVAAAWRNSTFNLSSRTSSLSKLTEMLRFHHRIARECPRLLSPLDVAVGDLRLARAALHRLRVRTGQLIRTRHGGQA